ncbi:MAG: AraC family transcriptional regulator [Muribaculaceae bacterium]|nr:AraC family transcriptional regulator [Muribaculaceae bacterium]
MNGQPKLMNFSRMRDAFAPTFEQLSDHIFFSQELAIVHGNKQLYHLLIQQQPPFAIDDRRFVIFLRGKATIDINLKRSEYVPQSLVFLGPGTIINPVTVTDDIELLVLAVFPPFILPFAEGQMPAAFNGQERDFRLDPDPADFDIARRIVDTLWMLVHQADYSRATAAALVAALMRHYDDLHSRQSERLRATRTHEQTVLDRFLYLVNSHAARQHQIGFYASKLCLTERYLGTVVRQASGLTAKEWIDRAIVLRIKVALRHTDKTAAQISEEFNFPNPSFFVKYFKRLTSLTPAQYRRL